MFCSPVDLCIIIRVSLTVFGMDQFLSGVVSEVKKYFPQLDKDRVAEAYKISEEVYEMKRATEFENDFIIQPKDVVTELLQFKPDEDTVISTLLYDAVDSNRLSFQGVEDHFGIEIRDLLEGLQILKSIKVERYQSADKLDLLRKLFLVMAKDIRVLVIFLGVKIVQVRLLPKLPQDCAAGFATDVLEIFVPIALRLGIYKFKTVLEDECFKILNPESYKYISSYLEKLGESKKEYIDSVCKTLRDFYEENGFKGVKVSGRLKGHYSIFNKMKKKNVDDVDDIFDIFAVRVVLPMVYNDYRDEDISILYSALGLLHSRWKPIPSRFKDYVAVPKPNGYRSLHTTVIGLSDGKAIHPVEIQIRSSLMHEEAEYGVASHWLYKDAGGRALSILKSHVDWLSSLASLHADMKEGDEKVLDSVRLDLFGDRIYVLTPKGEVKDLPKGATPLDFAYAVHTDIGHACVLTKVNGKSVPLNTELENGDTVEIVTKKGNTPKLEWLPIVKTSQAKVKIKNWFASQNQEKHIKIGKDQLNTQLRRYGKPALTPSLSILKDYGGKNLSFQDREKILEEIGKSSQLASNVIRKVYNYEDLLDFSKTKILKKRDGKVKGILSLNTKNIVLGGVSKVAVTIAKCCGPMPGDEIVGYISTLKGSVKIHKKDCPLLKKLNKNKIVSASVKEVSESARALSGPQMYRVKIKIEVNSRVGLLGDIGSTIAANRVNIYSYSALPPDETRKVSHIFMDLDVESLDQFEKVLDSVEKVKDVLKVTRF